MVQKKGNIKVIVALQVVTLLFFTSCRIKPEQTKIAVMSEKQITFSDKNHALDNNDNFSPDDKFLCYDTRGTVYNDNLANCKSIEKVEIATGKETVLYEPESVTGEQAAPGVAAVSWHPSENKVVFIHGPLLREVPERGYYGITNRTGVEVSADGLGKITKVDMRDVATTRPTTPGAQRGGTHRHEYAREGSRIGFTYDDFLLPNYDRTIGYMEENVAAPEGYTHYFALILKPAEKGKSNPGEIEKAYGDSWVDSKGTMRAFIGKVRAENGIDYDTSLFVADIPETVDVTTAKSGSATDCPEPPEGIKIRRLTHSGTVSGIVRGSFDGKYIAYLCKDENEVEQIYIINALGSDLSAESEMQPQKVSTLTESASYVRWHPSKYWIFSVVNGNVLITSAEPGGSFGKTIQLTNDTINKTELVVSHDGKLLAYNKINRKEGSDKEWKQIFVLELDEEKIDKLLHN